MSDRMGGLESNIRDWQSEGNHLQQGVSFEGPRLIHRLLGKHWGYRKLSKVCGLSPTYLCRMANGKMLMSFSAYLRLCKIEREGGGG